MNTKAVQLFALGIALTGWRACGQGTTLWNEAINGQFSHDFENPTTLSVLDNGTNSLLGTAEIVPAGNNWISTPDFFLIQIPVGFKVSTIFLQLNKTNVWLGVKDASYQSDIGFTGNSLNGDLMPQLGLSQLTAGAYGMYVLSNDQQSSASIVTYRLDVILQPVPEPSGLYLFGGGLALFGFRLWCGKRRSSK